MKSSSSQHLGIMEMLYAWAKIELEVELKRQ
jgi:hypothetical protein